MKTQAKRKVFFRKEDQRRKEQGEQKLSLEEKREVVTELFGKSTREGQRVLMERSPDVIIPAEKTRPLPKQKTLVQFVASAELMAKLEELKNLMAHKNFEGRMDVLMDQIADLALNELRPKAPTQTSPTAAAKLPAPPAQGVTQSAQLTTQRSRYIPAAEKRKVLLRDKNGCTYKNTQTGRVCQSKHGLQLDHVVPFSLGGQNTADNLTLLCGAHNRYRAEQMGLSLGLF